MTELFDKKFVHCMADEALVGTTGIIADSLTTLYERVNDIKTNNNVDTIMDISGGNFPFECGSCCYRYYYYDPNYDCKRAYLLGGNLIQCRSNPAYRWIDDSNPTWEDSFEYRVKPKESELKAEQKQKRMTYQQFAEWLARGNGEYKYKGASLHCVALSYEECYRNKELPSGYIIQHWGVDEWLEPTEDIFIEDCRGNANRRLEPTED